MFENFRKTIANILLPVKNSVSVANDFLLGNTKRMTSNWTDVAMSDQDLYTGYSFAAIRNRANKVAQIANDFVKTNSESKKEGFTHPYLEILTKSPTFSDYWFWYVISTYLDLEGVFYLMVIRTVQGGRIGNTKEFKLLNPYHVRRVLDTNNMEVIGYIETRNGMIREIPKDMIIPISELNPFNANVPFAMTDAAKESAFTLKTSGDYTRHALKNNINAPGILSTDVILEEQDFKNFKNRVVNHTKGEPIFGNGQGAITFQSMQLELSKAALMDVDNMNRDALFSVAGVSKTMMGIEQSGTTRETAKVQKELFIEGHIIPRITLIIDALNQDYKNKYPKDYEETKADIIIDNPLASDHEAEQADVLAKDAQLDLYQKLIDMGYDMVKASKFVDGQIGVEDLGKPKNAPKPVAPELLDEVKKLLAPKEEPPVTPPADTPPTPPTPPVPPANKLDIHVHTHVDNKAGDKTEGQHIIKTQEGALKNAIVNIEEQLVAAAINRVQKTKNAFDEEGDLITKTEKKKSYNELVATLVAFYGIVISLKGPEVMRDRVGQFALYAQFNVNKDVRSFIKEVSKKVAESHIDTITTDILVTARAAALEGLSQDQIINRIKDTYSSEIVEGRAKVIARTETNRAFTQAQFEADQQFVDQNDLGGRAFKQWTVRSANPCDFCQALADEPPIPLDDAFRSLGQDVTVGKGEDKKSLSISFESLEAGNAHPNCSCEYTLIIENE